MDAVSIVTKNVAAGTDLDRCKRDRVSFALYAFEQVLRGLHQSV